MKKEYILLLIIVTIGIFLRFYNLNWGAPFYFHPDERNIASSISQLSFPNQMNPHFFAYGSLPLYLIYFSGLLISTIISLVHNLPISTIITFENAILVSRFYSAVLSSGTILLLFLIGKKIHTTAYGLFCSFLAATTVGFIQYAHFGTFEMWLTFFTTLLLYVCLLISSKSHIKFSIIAGVILGILLAIKISSVVLIPLPLIALIFSNYNLKKNKFIKTVLLNYLVIIFLCAVSFFVFSPFVILDYPAFLHSMRYESQVALGTFPVFYTQSFLKTTPILYHFTHIFPFLLNPIVNVFFIIIFPLFLYKAFRFRNKNNILILLFFIVLFFSQVFLYVKWTRYMIPIIPFMLLMLGEVLFDLQRRFYLFKKASILLALYCVFHAILFISEVYMSPDSRIAAANFAQKNIPPSASILSESFDMGIVPFNSRFKNITLFNFYDLDTQISMNNELEILLHNTEYIILPSERIIDTRTRLKEDFPKGFIFYTQLSRQEDTFKKKYQSPCLLVCKLIYNFGTIEETARVFDNPTVYIFKKIQ